MKHLLIILIFFAFAANGQDSLKELIPLLPKDSKLTFSQWKSDPKQIWVKGSTKGELPANEICDGLPAGNILITYNFYNLFNETGKANLLSEKAYISDSYDRIKSDMQYAIDSEKSGKQYSGFTNLSEETIGDGKAFYYDRSFVCKSSSAKMKYVSYVAYLPVKPGFIELNINYTGNLEQVKAFAKEVAANMKNFESYNFFNR